MESNSATEVTATEIVLTWGEYFNNQNFDLLNVLYSKRATLVPTFSPAIITDFSGREAYFAGLKARKRPEVNIDETTLRAEAIGEPLYIVTGFYTFMFEIDSALKQFPANFTFIVDCSKSQPILHHHSSQLPTAS